MLCKTIDSAASSVDMLDAFVQRAKTSQAESHTIEDSIRRSNLILDTAKEQEKRLTTLHKEYASDAARQQRFQSVVADLEQLFLPQAALISLVPGFGLGTKVAPSIVLFNFPLIHRQLWSYHHGRHLVVQPFRMPACH